MKKRILITFVIALSLFACAIPEPTQTAESFERLWVFIPTDNLRIEAVKDAGRRGWKPIRVEINGDEVIIIFGER